MKKILNTDLPNEKEKVKTRGRKVKDLTSVKVTKKRGRKPEMAFFGSSAAKRAMKEASKEQSINNCNILQLNVDTSVALNDLSYEALDEGKFKFFQTEQNKDIVERYLELRNEDSSISLEDLYKEKLKIREDQNEVILNKFKEFHNKDVPLTEIQDPADTFEVIPSVKVEKCKSTLIEDLGAKVDIEILKDLVDKPWMESLNIKCWWCCYIFNTIPVSLPVKYNERLKKFVTKGLFCSIACMYAYGCIYYHSELNIITPLVKFLYKRLTGCEMNKKIVPALPRETLIDFGGELTIEAFREHSKNNRVYKRIEYPMIIKKDIIHLSDIERIKKTQRNLNAGKDRKLEINKESIESSVRGDTIDAIMGIEYDD